MPGDIRRSRNGKRRLNKRGRRKRRIRRILSAAVVFVPLFAAAVFLKNFIGDHFRDDGFGITRDTGSYQVQNTTAVQSIPTARSGADSQRWRRRMRRSGRCLSRQISIRKICWNFLQITRRRLISVLGYTEKKDDVPAEDIGDITSGEIPLLIQWDERWGYAQYGDNRSPSTAAVPQWWQWWRPG